MTWKTLVDINTSYIWHIIGVNAFFDPCARSLDLDDQTLLSIGPILAAHQLADATAAKQAVVGELDLLPFRLILAAPLIGGCNSYQTSHSGRVRFFVRLLMCLWVLV